MRRGGLCRAVVGAVVVVLATACGGGAGEQAPPPAHDPPASFAPASGQLFRGPTSRVFGRDVDNLPVGLEGTTVWTTDGGVLARVDSTGTATALALPPGRTAGGAPLAVPGTSVVVAGAAAIIPGSGTTPPGLAAELLAVDRTADPSASSITWSASAPLGWNTRPDAVRLRVAGVSAGVAVLSASSTDQRTTLGVDLATRRVLWSADGVAATGVLTAPAAVLAVATPPGTNPSYAPSRVVLLDPLRGTQRASVAELSGADVRVAGPGLAAVTGRDRSTARATLTFVDARGATVRPVDLGTASSAPRCVWDERSVTVCSGGARAFAVDAASADPLWSLPDPAADRVAPAVTTAWHGAVYGTTVNGPVVLDARTGADRNPAPGGAPLFVNAYLGVGLAPGALGGVVIWPASG